jgi:hypothetical protein
MRHMSEPLTPTARFLHDAGTLALLALVLIPLYLLAVFLLHASGQLYPSCHAAPTSRNPTVAHAPDGCAIASRAGETF